MASNDAENKKTQQFSGYWDLRRKPTALIEIVKAAKECLELELQGKNCTRMRIRREGGSWGLSEGRGVAFA